MKIYDKVYGKRSNNDNICKEIMKLCWNTETVYTPIFHVTYN